MLNRSIAYARVGLAIINVDNLVPPGRRTSSYHIPASIGSLVGEVPAIAVDLLNQEQVRFAYRSTSLLRSHYGAVKLVGDSLPEQWRGQAGKDKVQHLLNTRLPQSKKGLNNLGIQTLSSLVNFMPSTIPELFPKTCKDSRFQGVTIISSTQHPILNRDFTYTSVWNMEAPIFSRTTDHFTSNAFPLFSESSLKALAFLPSSAKLIQKQQGQAWYLAGVGSNDRNLTVLESLEHPYAHVLASLPQTLFIAAMLHYYKTNHHLHMESIHNHFDTLYGQVIKDSPGIVDPWAYFGTRGSFFPFHQEDGLLPSANLMVLGDPKVWIFVKESGMELLRALLGEYIQPCYMLHRSVFFHPQFLAKNNIPFTIAVQCEGELILADARSGHQGWNMGPNLAEAVNYANMSAIEYQKEELYRDGMAVWPCVCGHNPAPTNPDQLRGDANSQSLFLYKPEWDLQDGLGCSALYEWTDTLLRQLELAPLSPLTSAQLLELRDYVYKKKEEK